MANNAGGARRQAEDAYDAVSLPVTDLRIALVIGGEALPHFGPGRTATPEVKALLAQIKESAVENESLGEALRFLLLAGGYGQDTSEVLPLARELAAKSKRKRDKEAAAIVTRDTRQWTAGEARKVLSSGLGPAALVAASVALERAGKPAEAARALGRLEENALAARVKAGVSSVALLLVMLGGTSTWALFSAVRKRPEAASRDFGVGAPDSYPQGLAPSLWVAFALFVALYVGLAFAVTEESALLKTGIASDSMLELAHYLVAAAAAFAIVPLYLRSRRLSFKDLGWTSRDWVVDIGWGIGGFLAATALVMALQMITSIVLSALGGGEPSRVTSPAAEFLVGARFGWKVALLLVVVGVVAPLLEETFFRGALLRAAGAEWGTKAAMIVSVVAFAAIHPGMPELLAPYLGIGYVLAKLAVVRRSLLPCFIAHALNNLFFVGIVMLLQL